MKPILLDSCALLWWTLDPEQLSPTARVLCDQIPHSQAIISSVSVWELGVKIKNNKLSIGTTIEDYAQRLKQISYLTILPVDLDIWLASLALDWSHKDPADRIIIATAQRHNLSILSSDKIIADFYPNTVF